MRCSGQYDDGIADGNLTSCTSRAGCDLDECPARPCGRYYVEFGQLVEYYTGRPLRPATAAETRAGLEAPLRWRGHGIITDNDLEVV